MIARVLALLLVASTAAAQTPEASSANAREECYKKALEKGLQGRHASADAAICVAEARLECTKQVVASDPAPRRWNGLVRKCLGMDDGD